MKWNGSLRLAPAPLPEESCVHRPFQGDNVTEHKGGGQTDLTAEQVSEIREILERQGKTPWTEAAGPAGGLRFPMACPWPGFSENLRTAKKEQSFFIQDRRFFYRFFPPRPIK